MTTDLPQIQELNQQESIEEEEESKKEQDVEDEGPKKIIRTNAIKLDEDPEVSCDCLFISFIDT